MGLWSSLKRDIAAIYKGDPAANNIWEILFA